MSISTKNEPANYLKNNCDNCTEYKHYQKEKRYNQLWNLLIEQAPLSRILGLLVLLIESEQAEMIGSILLLSNDKKHLVHGAAPSLPGFYNQAINNFEIGENKGSCGAAAYSKQRVIVTNTSTHPNWASVKGLAEQAGLAACWSEPILSKDNTLFGTFAMYYKTPKEPTPKDIILIKEAAKLASFVIEHFRLFENAQILSSIFEHSHYGIGVLDTDFTLLSVNNAFSEITGYSSDDALGNNSTELLAGGSDTREFYPRMIESLKTEGYWKGEVQHKRKDGSYYDNNLLVSSIKDNNKIQKYLCIFSDITSRKQAERNVQKQAYYDHLSGIPNRRSFYNSLSTLLDKSKKIPTFALAIIDLDNFKSINDSFGHEKGDELIFEMAKRIQSVIDEKDTLARLGGDEFALILMDVEQYEQIEKILIKVLATIKQPFTFNDEIVISQSVSIGVSRANIDSTNINSLIKYADHAMYQAKEQGRNCFKFFNAELQNELEEELSLSYDLRAAIENQELEVYYQPIVINNSSKIVKMEALLRWKHPDKGFISPEVFIAIAEKRALIETIGIWMRKQVCSQIYLWKESGFNVIVSVNISPVEFSKNQFAQRLINTIESCSISNEDIMLEITEGVLLNNTVKTQETLAFLAKNNIKISLDDFGTGYSSFSYLINYPIQQLKIDRSFIDNIENDKKKQVLVESILHLANGLTIDVVAEGVENEQQACLLQEKGCDHFQGYLYYRPMNSGQLTNILGNS